MRILLIVLTIFSSNAFGILDHSIMKSVKLCTLSIMSSDYEYLPEDAFYEKDFSKKIDKKVNYGTGFFYSKDKSYTNSILTNFHVIENALKERLKIIGCNSEICNQLEVISIDKKSDIAMLVSKEDFNCDNSFSLEPNPIESSKIFIYGNKFGLNNSFSFGVLGAKNRKISDRKFFHIIDINAGEGNSGSPIFLDNSMKIIGMMKSIYSAGNSSVAFGITADEIEASIQRMENILKLETQLEFNIIQDDGRIYFAKNDKENGFFEKFSLLPSDEIQYMDKKPVSSKVEILYDIYEFLKDETRLHLKIIFISSDGNLKNTTLTKYRGYTDNSI